MKKTSAQWIKSIKKKRNKRGKAPNLNKVLLSELSPELREIAQTLFKNPIEGNNNPFTPIVETFEDFCEAVELI